MNSIRQPAPPTLPSGVWRGQRGFTLLEVGLVLLCLFFASSLALAELRKYQHRAACDRFVAELRTLAAAFEAHYAEKGTWPPATHAESRMPRGLEAALGGTRWLEGPPFGGAYDWVPPRLPPKPEKEEAEAKPTLPPGMIAVTAFAPAPPLPLSARDLAAIDAKLDDGNLSTGRFRTGFNGWPVYLIPSSR